MQTNGARYSRVPETSLGNEWWLYGGQHGFRLGYSCESQMVSLLGYHGFNGRGSQDRRDNNRLFKDLQFSST